MSSSMDYSRKIRKKSALSAGDNVGSPRKGVKFRQKIIFSVVFLLLALALFFSASYWWREQRWRFIVIHHSASDAGNLESIRKMHMTERGWSDIAYHFVVNNGTFNTAPGQVEISNLWIRRSANFSTRNSFANQFGIAVVLVGNFDKRPLPLLQKEALVRLLANLARTHGIAPERIIGHRDLQHTACPGQFIDLDEIRGRVARLLRD